MYRVMLGHTLMGALVYERPELCWDLRPDEIRVCSVRLAGSHECIERFSRLLTDEELERAGRFRTRVLRERFILGRGILRAALAQPLATAPSAVAFTYGDQGKPFVDNDRGLQFNLSHSDEQALFAISFERELGIDIERIRSLSNMEEIALRFFCVEEYNNLMDLHSELTRTAAFFRCWTSKEAYIKAIGGGLSLPLNSFRVTLLPDEPPLLVTSEPKGGWALRDISPGFGYSAALVFNGAPAVIRAWQFSDATECAEYFEI
jgi:4'-phosphopantetheinyl transferase